VSHLADRQRKDVASVVSGRDTCGPEDSTTNYPDHGYALHYESIKRGVRKVSEIRVAEMAEDYLGYGVARTAARPQRSMRVTAIEERWSATFPGGLQSSARTDSLLSMLSEGGPGARTDLDDSEFSKPRKTVGSTCLTCIESASDSGERVVSGCPSGTSEIWDPPDSLLVVPPDNDARPDVRSRHARWLTSI